ncbi:hypothetical protein BDF22DRAFT_220543 [Syncephalis plumigaleata]|nr:hypothetical protein BDF22DRAFT_220543 [Syncephalis plumigaleata]
MGKSSKFHCDLFVLAARPWPNNNAPIDKKTGQKITSQRIGYLTSKKKISKLAVKRNRARRRLAAAAFDILPKYAKSGYDFLLIARSEVLTADYTHITDELLRAVKTLKLQSKPLP